MNWLSFLRIVDEAGKLSITNISVVALVAKILCRPSASIPDAIALAIAVSAYVGKKIVLYHQSKIQKPSYNVAEMSAKLEEVQRELEDQKAKVSALNLQSSLRSQPRVPIR